MNKAFRQLSFEICVELGEIPLRYKDRGQAFKRICELGQQAMNSRACTLALVDLEERWWEQVGCVGFDDEYEKRMANRRLRLGSRAEGATLDYDLVARGKLVEAYGLQEDGQGIANPAVARRYGLQSALCCPLFWEDRLLGYFNHFSTSSEPFTSQARELIRFFARHAATTIQVVDQLERAASHERLTALNRFMLAATEVRDVNRLLELVLEKGLELVGCSRGTISRLNFGTGRLEVVAWRGGAATFPALRVGQGITGLALKEEHAIRANDVDQPLWRDVYVRFWPDTRSELAVPIVVRNAPVRVGRKVMWASKPIGVFNVESPTPGAFSQTDEDLLVSLAEYVAVLIDRLELDRKLAHLGEIQQAIVKLLDWDAIIEVMIKAITDTLGYDYVNISLVDEERRRIRTEYIEGIPDFQKEEFKRLADHPLDSNDIQADIVRTRQIEVPDVKDPRFDQEIYRRFRHDRLIRVYVPMVVPSENRVIGVVEAGYRRRYRRHIYEQDIQILKGFVEYVTRALEPRQRGLLDQITHELRSPIVGVRSNASFLQRRLHELSEDVVQRKFDDILADCEILLYQVKELEYMLGKPSPEAKVERTLVFRDVIIKTVRQLKPLLRERGFETSKIVYDAADIRRIPPLYVNKSQLNQVVYNLLINAIKYAEDDPDRFSIFIRVSRTREGYVIAFKDWGIGIQPQYADRVFEPGFRTPEARQKHVTGSGLGLSIARQIMQELGGDLRLASLRKPTEFHLVLPAQLTEVPYDTDH